MKCRMFALAVLLTALVAVDHAQNPQRAGGAPAPGRGGVPTAPLLIEAHPKPLIASVAPVRSCESLTTVTLPDTTIESATMDAATGTCRVVATTTHPPF